jgi:ribonuclease P protein component
MSKKESLLKEDVLSGISVVSLRKATSLKPKTIVLVSKKTEKRAVKRNLAKRRIRESVFFFKKRNPQFKELVFIVLVRSVNISFPNINRSLERHFNKKPL